ncbi:hypothetical protein [Rhizobium freirei]|uniref:hypothetical protein n=1 Tax=Rhizobium freirei TaxID=1353277 RepID=UPI001F0A6905|nr:hypothetical protein [Rhizobium freirei]
MAELPLLLVEMEKAGDDGERFAAPDLAFHQAILRMSGKGADRLPCRADRDGAESSASVSPTIIRRVNVTPCHCTAMWWRISRRAIRRPTAML